MDAFEEAVVLLGAAGDGGFLVGVVDEDLLAVRFLDLGVRSTVTVFAQAEDGIVVLVLGRCELVVNR